MKLWKMEETSEDGKLKAVMWIRIDCIRIWIPVRIQVNKITKFLKHLLIFKSKKRYELRKEVAVSKHQHLLFLGSDLKNIISFFVVG